MILPT